MAFTRSDLGQTSSFTRSGATSFISTPNFQVFEVTDSATSFSLSNNWVLETGGGGGVTPFLNFKYNGNSMLEVTTAGITNLLLPSLKLKNNNGLPNTSGYAVGDVVKASSRLYLLIDDGLSSD